MEARAGIILRGARSACGSESSLPAPDCCLHPALRCDGGESGNRTRDRAFAEPGLTTWLSRHHTERTSAKRTGGTKSPLEETVNGLAGRGREPGMSRRSALFRLSAAYRRKIATMPPNCMLISGAFRHTVPHWITPIQSEPPESASQPGSPMSAGMRKLLLQLQSTIHYGRQITKIKTEEQGPEAGQIQRLRQGKAARHRQQTSGPCRSSEEEGLKVASLITRSHQRQGPQMIIPAATVSLVCESIRMKLPVARFCR